VVYAYHELGDLVAAYGARFLFEAVVKRRKTARSIGCGGIAETDPGFDVDRWDATVKVSARVQMGTTRSSRMTSRARASAG